MNISFQRMSVRQRGCSSLTGDLQCSGAGGDLCGGDEVISVHHVGDQGADKGVAGTGTVDGDNVPGRDPAFTAKFPALDVRTVSPQCHDHGSDSGIKKTVNGFIDICGIRHDLK